jgi:hypothetical protein
MGYSEIIQDTKHSSMCGSCGRDKLICERDYQYFLQKKINKETDPNVIHHMHVPENTVKAMLFNNDSKKEVSEEESVLESSNDDSDEECVPKPEPSSDDLDDLPDLLTDELVEPEIDHTENDTEFVIGEWESATGFSEAILNGSITELMENVILSNNYYQFYSMMPFMRLKKITVADILDVIKNNQIISNLDLSSVKYCELWKALVVYDNYQQVCTNTVSCIMQIMAKLDNFPDKYYNNIARAFIYNCMPVEFSDPSNDIDTYTNCINKYIKNCRIYSPELCAHATLILTASIINNEHFKHTLALATSPLRSALDHALKIVKNNKQE